LAALLLFPPQTPPPRLRFSKLRGMSPLRFVKRLYLSNVFFHGTAAPRALSPFSSSVVCVPFSLTPPFSCRSRPLFSASFLDKLFPPDACPIRLRLILDPFKDVLLTLRCYSLPQSFNPLSPSSLTIWAPSVPLLPHGTHFAPSLASLEITRRRMVHIAPPFLPPTVDVALPTHIIFSPATGVPTLSPIPGTDLTFSDLDSSTPNVRPMALRSFSQPFHPWSHHDTRDGLSVHIF